MAEAPGAFFSSLKQQAESVKQKITPAQLQSQLSLKDEKEDEKWLQALRTILDELFDLTARGKWFRRQISQLATTILENSFFAGKITHRMREITEELTSDATVSGYVEKLKNSLFPEGYPALPKVLFLRSVFFSLNYSEKANRQ